MIVHHPFYSIKYIVIILLFSDSETPFFVRVVNAHAH